MTIAVADTHTVVWYLFNNPKLSVTARRTIENGLRDGNQIGVSSITLAEMVYLVEKDRIPRNALAELLKALSDPEHPLREIPFERSVAETMQNVPREDIPDMPDRIIAATGLRWGIPVISRDGKIKSSSLETIW
jgi:PIN domain nuclease of toxin-antitoxin system